MNKPGRRKLAIYGLMLGAALIGLMVDRLQGPSAAQAAGPGPAVHRVDGIQATNLNTDLKGPPIARIFQQDAKSDNSSESTVEAAAVRDAFALTSEMRALYAEEPPEKKAEAARAAEDAEQLRQREIDDFQNTHKLKGTTLRDSEAWAIINEQIVRVGESIDGFELHRVERYRVYLEKGDITLVLQLPVPF
jgi:hypothetical protein